MVSSFIRLRGQGSRSPGSTGCRRWCGPARLRASGDRVGRVAAQLADALDQREQPVHAGVDARQAAAVGVDRQAAAGRDRAAGDERPALALGAKAEVFEEQDRVDGEGIVELDDIDVAGANAGLRRYARGPLFAAAVTVRSGMRAIWW